MSNVEIFVTGAPTGKSRYVIRDSHVHREVDLEYIQSHPDWYTYEGYTRLNGDTVHYYSIPDIEE